MLSYWRPFAVCFAAIFVVALLLPASLQVEREIEVNAHAATVFALVNDFRQINRWSALLDEDPNVYFEISGPPRGVGASMRWQGQIIGRGQQTITASTPFRSVSSTLMLDDDRAAETGFALAEMDGRTHVSLTYDEALGFNVPGRLIALLRDGIVAAGLEKDLVNLKRFAESLPDEDFGSLVVEQLDVVASDIAYRTSTSLPDATAISEAMGDAYYDVLSFIDEYQLEEVGAPLSITRTFSGSELVFDAAIPVRGIQADTPRDGSIVRIGKTYAGPVVRVRHAGPYRTLGRTHQQIAAWLAAMGIERNGDAWEVYISDPTKTIESELLTYIYYPVRYRHPGD